MPTMDKEEAGRLAEELYENKLRYAVETEENIGKLITIDVLSGDYIVAPESKCTGPSEAVEEMLARHPDAAVFTLRIGYNAVYAVGGSIVSLTPPMSPPQRINDF